MKKAVHIALGFAFCLVVAFTGCGPNASPSAAKPAEKQIAFKIVNWGSPAQQELLKSVMDNYSKQKPDVKTDLVQVAYAEFTEKVTTMIASGNPPDITWWSENSFHYFADKGYFLALDNAITQWGTEWDYGDFYPTMIEEGKYKGKMYGLPFSTPAHVLYYNKKLFDNAKIKYPDENSTWEDVAKAAQALTGGEGANKIYGITNLLDKGKEWQNLLDIIRPYGGSFMSDDRTKCTINSPEAKQAIQLYLGLLKGGYTNKPGANAPFEQGKAAMFLGYLSYNGAFVTAPNLDYDITYVPKGPKGRSNLAGYAYYVAMKTTRFPTETLDLMRYVTSKETCKITSKIWGPARKSVGLSAGYMAEVPKPAGKQIFIKSLEFSRPQEHFVAFKDASTVIQEEFDKIFFEKQTVDQGLANVEKKINELVAPKK